MKVKLKEMTLKQLDTELQELMEAFCIGMINSEDIGKVVKELSSRGAKDVLERHEKHILELTPEYHMFCRQ